MKQTRRAFCRDAAWVLAGGIFVPTYTKAQRAMPWLPATKKGSGSGGGGGGGPTLVASDDFSWATGSYQNIDVDSDWTILQGTVQVINTYGTGSALSASASASTAAYFDTVAASQDQRVEGTITSVSAGYYMGIGVRQQSGPSYYGLVATDNSLSLYQMISGSQTNLGSIYNGTRSAGDKIALSATGSGAATRLTVQLDTGGGWANVTGQTDITPNDYLGSGRGGVAGSGQTGDAAIDDFKWYNL